MSIAFRTKGLIDFAAKSPTQTEVPNHSVETEAPELAVTLSEAPESRHGRHAEAPDAGEGRRHYFEQDFTHGRSQS